MSEPHWPEPPEENLKFPSDISDLDSKTLSMLIGKYTNLQNWAASQAAEAEVLYIKTETELEDHLAQLYRSEPFLLTALNKNQREEKLMTYPKHQAMVRMRRALLARKTTYTTAAENYGRCIWALSRELSRKITSLDGVKYERSFRS